MSNILKTLREERGLTQESVADKLEISVNTIQNWERNGKISKEPLHLLLDFYGVDKLTRDKVVLSIFGDNGTAEKRVGVDRFPYFLFEERQDISLSAKRAVLTAEEMELFGYTYYMNGKIDRHSYSNKSGLYDYRLFKDYGGYFKTMKMIENIEEKIGKYIGTSSSYDKDLPSIVYNYGIESSGSPFSFCELNKEDIANLIKYLPNIEKKQIDISSLYSICKAIGDGVCIDTDDKSYLDSYNKKLPDVIRSIVENVSYYSSNKKYAIRLDDVSARCIVIEKVESQDILYLEKKRQYLSDKEVFDKHPGLYEREPTFAYKFSYILKLTQVGRRYVEWYETV